MVCGIVWDGGGNSVKCGIGNYLEPLFRDSFFILRNMLVHTIDLRFQNTRHAIGSFLVEGKKGVILIETGPGSTTGNLVTGIQDLGFRPSDVQHVFVTHIHLDHSAGAGWWAKQGAQIYVHPRGARHLIDPSRLMASAKMVYGDVLDDLFGEMIPIPENQVTIVQDSDIIEIDDLVFTAYDTPGHATHHLAYGIDGNLFTGDMAGSRLPNDYFINLTSAPPQFDPDAFDASITRMESLNFERLYLTHFGVVEDVADHWVRLRKIVWDSTKFIREQLENGASDSAAIQRYVRKCRQRALAEGVSPALLDSYDTANGFEMSGEGIVIYWKRRWRKEQENG